MTRPLDDLLARFTPAGSGIDRDALLFAAGKASARPSRPWIALAGCLAFSQVLTLALLWPRTPPLRDPAPSTPAPAPPPARVVPEPSSVPQPPPPEGPLVLSPHVLKEWEALPPPEGMDALVPDKRPLRAFVSTVPLD